MAKVEVKDMEDYDLFDYGGILCFKIENPSVQAPGRCTDTAAAFPNESGVYSLCCFNGMEEYEVIGNIKEALANARQKILEQYK